ncbi:hypothetical protein [Formosa haliotis]|uniref:hypothetical protein n=1 Tax=Formosa haliotis TaxID=1555194 RepID=UPI0011476F93|nr:hypothetical protein [Formosa haliotis]
MKKLYSSILIALAATTVSSAQVVVDFSDDSYHTTEVTTNLGNHADWSYGGGAWRVDGDNDQIVNLKANWQLCVYNIPFKQKRLEMCCLPKLPHGWVAMNLIF